MNYFAFYKSHRDGNSPPAFHFQLFNAPSESLCGGARAFGQRGSVCLAPPVSREKKHFPRHFTLLRALNEKARDYRRLLYCSVGFASLSFPSPYDADRSTPEANRPQFARRQSSSPRAPVLITRDDVHLARSGLINLAPFWQAAGLALGLAHLLSWVLTAHAPKVFLFIYFPITAAPVSVPLLLAPTTTKFDE